MEMSGTGCHAGLSKAGLQVPGLGGVGPLARREDATAMALAEEINDHLARWAHRDLELEEGADGTAVYLCERGQRVQRLSAEAVPVVLHQLQRVRRLLTGVRTPN